MGPPQTRQAFDDVCHVWLMNMKHGTELTCVIQNNANHAFLGLVALHRVQSECPELGIWIREDQHKLGFGFEAVHCLAH
jgi:RimJ/RimL family protein N-acetyltransferase